MNGRIKNINDLLQYHKMTLHFSVIFLTNLNI
nr:MAG TPA: hypothetical protein [Caudoviricetes sp.]